ncbi:MAG: SPOR domain-containing protein [Sphingomicrobium sp.]
MGIGLSTRLMAGTLAVLALGAAPLDAQSSKAGIEAWARGDYANALAIWGPLAARGDPDAMFNLGQIYRLGRGVPIDLGEAERWYSRAARAGHVDAQTQLGMLLFQNGYPRAGVSWLHKAADRGDARAQLLYGTALFNGDADLKRDVLGGYVYVAKAARQGLGAARSTLADMDREIPEHLRKLAMAGINAKPSAGVAAMVPPGSKSAPLAPFKPTALRTAAPATSGGGKWRIQLGAFGQRGAAAALFRALSSGPLTGRQPFLIPVGAVTRLQAGPFASKAEASAACATLAARRQPCFVVAAP